MKKKKYVNLEIDELLHAKEFITLPPIARILFIELYSQKYKGDKNGGWFYCEDHELQENTGLSLRSITNTKNILVDKNFIKKKVTTYTGKRLKSTDYLIIFPLIK